MATSAGAREYKVDRSEIAVVIGRNGWISQQMGPAAWSWVGYTGSDRADFAHTVCEAR